jgi:hypothetical protein
VMRDLVQGVQSKLQVGLASRGSADPSGRLERGLRLAARSGPPRGWIEQRSKLRVVVAAAGANAERRRFALSAACRAIRSVSTSAPRERYAAPSRRRRRVLPG